MGFLVLLFPSSKQRAIKRNTKLGLTGNSGVKEKLSSHVQIKSFETRTQQALPKIICRALLRSARNIEISSVLWHLISRLPETSYKPVRSNAPFPRGATESTPRSKRNRTAFEYGTHKYSSNGTHTLYFFFLL